MVAGIFLSLSNNLQHLASELTHQLAVIIFLDKRLTLPEKETLENRIKQSPLVLKVEYISSEEAASRFIQNFPDLQATLRDLGSNPFPPSLEVTIQEKYSRSSLLNSFLDSLRREPRVVDIQFNRDWIARVEAIDRVVKALGAFLASILILASVFIVSNVIRLSVMARQDEISILRLVGATNNFIRVPFLLEGTFLGILGSLVALFFLWLIIKLFPLYIGYSLGAFQHVFQLRALSLYQSLGLVIGGGTVGFFGSLSSLSRFLKI